MKKVGCKLFTYAKLRDMFEKEEIDEYSKKASDKEKFVKELVRQLSEKCLDNLEKNPAIIDAGVYR